VPHLSQRADAAVGAIRLACADASSASALADRVLSLLQPVLEFDGAELLAIDADSFFITRVLGHRGGRLADLARFLRDVYLIEPSPEWLDVAYLLQHTRGAAAFHERFDAWLRADHPTVLQQSFTRLWRRVGSPPGGGLRYGLRHSGRWIALLQAARWSPGPGFHPAHLELLDVVAASLGAAISRLLMPGDSAKLAAAIPPAGHLLFDHRRRLVAVDASGDEWLNRLPNDDLGRFGFEVPVSVMAVVNSLRRDDSTGPTECLTADRHGIAVIASAQKARRMGRQTGSGAWSAVTIAGANASATRFAASLTRRQHDVARGLSEGLSDREIATRLGIAPSTVHDHVAALHNHFGTRSRAGLVARLWS